MHAKLTVLWLALLPLCAYGVITGPTTATAYSNFTLTFSTPGYVTRLKDRSTGALLYGTTATFSKSTGTYVFEEFFCFEMPFGGGQSCSTLGNTFTVVVSGVAAGPASAYKQAEYLYQFRTGDFDGNGRQDVLMDRTTVGPIDGSMRTVILSQNANQTLTAKVPTAAELATARSYPLNSNISNKPTDLNVDGFTDQMISGLGLLGVATPMYVVFAPGTRGGSAPLGVRAMDDSFMQFFYDMRKSYENPNYFSQNVNFTARPVYGVTYFCPPASGDYGGFVPRFCFPVPVVTGVIISVQSAVSLDAMATASYVDTIAQLNDYSGGWRYWELSKIMYRVLGVHSFGFGADGTRSRTNTPVPDSTSEAEIRWNYLNFILWLFGKAIGDETSTATSPHTWDSVALICDPNNEQPPSAYLCTVANVWCWLKKFPAPRSANEGKTIRNGEKSVLAGDNHITTRVDETDHALYNGTVAPHILHNSNQPLDCPRTRFDANRDQCSETSRIVTQGADGKIYINTHGTGYNRFPKVNQTIGPPTFDYENLLIYQKQHAGAACVDDP